MLYLVLVYVMICLKNIKMKNNKKSTKIQALKIKKTKDIIDIKRLSTVEACFRLWKISKKLLYS